MELTPYTTSKGNRTYVFKRTKLKGCGGCMMNTGFKCPVVQFCAYISCDTRNYRCDEVVVVNKGEQKDVRAV